MNVVELIIRAKDLTAAAFSGAEKRILSVGRVVKSVARDLAAMGVAAGGAVLALTKLGQRGAEFLAVQQTFNRLAGGAGVEALGRLQAQTEGVIAKFDLMKQANMALALGSAKTIEDFGEMAQIARSLGRALGVDMATALESLSIGIARRSRLFLDNLGIIIDVDLANREYAATLGKQVSALTEAEQQEAFRVKAMTEAKRLTDDLTGGTITGAEAMDRFAATLKNVKDLMAQIIAQSPLLTRVFDSMESFLFEVSGGSVMARGEMQAMQRLPVEALPAHRHRLNAMVTGAGSRLMAARSFVDPVTGMSDPSKVDEAKRDLEGLRGVIEALDARVRSAAAAIGGGGGGGVPLTGGKPFVATLENLKGALEAVAETRVKLQQANLAAMLATPGVQAEETAKKVAELNAELAQMLRVISMFGGERGIDMQLQLLAGRGRQLPGGGAMPLIARGVTPLEGFAATNRPFDPITNPQGQIRLPAIPGTGQTVPAAIRELSDAQRVVIGAFGNMAEAAIIGSQQMELAIITALQGIVAAIPMKGGGLFGMTLPGALAGAGLGILGAIFARRGKDEAVPVRLASVEPRAADELSRAQGVQRINVQVISPLSGEVLQEIETEIRRREARDVHPRLPRGVRLGG